MRKEIGAKREEVIDLYERAAHLASLAAPYRHARLKAVTIATSDQNTPVRFKDNATAEELRQEIMRRLAVLQEHGVIELEALPQPSGGIAN